MKLLPYTKIDGIRTVTDSEIKKLFTRTVSDGLDKIVFYEGTIQTEDQFLIAMKRVLFFIIKQQEETIGYVWLNRFENHTARQHFCVFKEYWGQSEQIGRDVLSMIMNRKDSHGTFIFDLLTGFVPAWNKRAIAFALKCGGKTYGVIPNAVWNHKKQKSEGAVFIYYTRGDA